MAFGFNPYNPYNPYQPAYYQPPMPDNLAQLRQAQQPPAQPQQPSNGFTWVQGEEGAKAFNVPANTTALLMDSDCSCFYLKTADASGMPLPLRIFDYKERTINKASSQTSGEYVAREEFEALVADVNALKKAKHGKEVNADAESSI